MLQSWSNTCSRERWFPTIVCTVTNHHISCGKWSSFTLLMWKIIIYVYATVTGRTLKYSSTRRQQILFVFLWFLSVYYWRAQLSSRFSSRSLISSRWKQLWHSQLDFGFWNILSEQLNMWMESCFSSTMWWYTCIKTLNYSQWKKAKKRTISYFTIWRGKKTPFSYQLGILKFAVFFANPILP